MHHVTPDSENGPTHTDNGVLLCWYHHRTITTSGWHIKMINKTPHLKAPAWLRGDGLWHPASRSPTRHVERLKQEQRERDSKREQQQRVKSECEQQAQSEPDPPKRDEPEQPQDNAA
ncbi:HNH endonuclease signature motif containing protein [Homoserinimonas sp. A520]